jgi:hypothetical protein
MNHDKRKNRGRADAGNAEMLELCDAGHAGPTHDIDWHIECLHQVGDDLGIRQPKWK